MYTHTDTLYTHTDTHTDTHTHTHTPTQDINLTTLSVNNPGVGAKILFMIAEGCMLIVLVIMIEELTPLIQVRYHPLSPPTLPSPTFPTLPYLPLRILYPLLPTLAVLPTPLLLLIQVRYHSYLGHKHL